MTSRDVIAWSHDLDYS